MWFTACGSSDAWPPTLPDAAASLEADAEDGGPPDAPADEGAAPADAAAQDWGAAPDADPALLAPVGETRGVVEDVFAGVARGWFYERHSVQGAAPVEVYAHAPAEAGGVLIARGEAEISRAMLQASLGLPTARVGFELRLPPGFSDTMYSLFFYGVGAQGEPRVELSGSPTTTLGTTFSGANFPQPPPPPFFDPWLALHQAFVLRASQGSAPVVFFGDSITYLMRRGTEPAFNHQTFGARWWDEYIAPMGAVNFGIAGEMTQGLIFRLQSGELAPPLAPQAVVILIGTNNVPGNLHRPTEIAEAIKSITRLVRVRAPGAKILLLDILPRGADDDPGAAQDRSKIAEVNQQLRPLSDEQTVYHLDLGPAFTHPSGAIRGELFANDGSINLHPNEIGYEIILRSVRDRLRQMVPSLP